MQSTKSTLLLLFVWANRLIRMTYSWTCTKVNTNYEIALRETKRMDILCMYEERDHAKETNTCHDSMAFS
jgi:hypothetical protein